MNKKNLYFRKDKKAQIYKRQAPTTNNYGDTVQGGYRPIAQNELWCYTKQLTQEQKYIAQAINQDETRLFVFNYLDNIELYDLILYKNKWYDITRVDHKEDYKTETFIYANDKTTEIDPDDLLPYSE